MQRLFLNLSYAFMATIVTFALACGPAETINLGGTGGDSDEDIPKTLPTESAIVEPELPSNFDVKTKPDFFYSAEQDSYVIVENGNEIEISVTLKNALPEDCFDIALAHEIFSYSIVMEDGSKVNVFDPINYFDLYLQLIGGVTVINGDDDDDDNNIYSLTVNYSDIVIGDKALGLEIGFIQPICNDDGIGNSGFEPVENFFVRIFFD